jgi:long-chain acyl-CoA synthetase
VAGRTIPRLWRDAVARGSAQAAYLTPQGAEWRAVAWPEAVEAVDELAHGLLDLGVGRGERFAILGRPSLDWAFLDFALAHVGAVPVGIYPDGSADDVAYVLEHSEAVGIFADDDEQLGKLGAVRPRHVLGPGDLAGLRVRGRAHEHAHPGAVDEAAAATGEDDLFTLIYTSGTTGPPKGCMITHRNYFEMTETINRLGNFAGPGDTLLIYLPLAHNFGRLLHLMGPYAGCTTAFVSTPLRLAKALPSVRPTVLPSVPLLWDRIHAAALAEVAARGPVARRVAALALRTKPTARLVFRKVHERLGGRVRLGISGGAPLTAETAALLDRIGIPVLEGYGLTECTTACTFNRPGEVRFGTVGRALPEMEVRIADDGEILIRSPTVFAGYYKDEEATRAVLTDDGWLRSGDLGELDGDGFLRITGRKKELIVTAGGKNVSPQNLETALTATPGVSQAVVLGDRRPYLVALLTLDEGASEDVGRDAVAAANEGRAAFEQIRRFAVIPRQFTAEAGEVTPTLKLRRGPIQEHFAKEIDALYPARRARD